MSQPPRPPAPPAEPQVPSDISQDRSAGPHSVTGDIVGNPADLKEGEILLPGFIVRKPGGLFADLALLEKQPNAFAEFVAHTFSADAYFPGLDYRAFQTILYDPETTAKVRANLVAAGRGTELRFADAVARFPQSRKSLYRAVKTSAQFADASYFLEPAVIEKTVSSIAEDGTLVNRTVTEPARLNFDELIAHLWNFGVRYGILEADVRGRVAEDMPKVGWITVARQLDPQPGKDAEIREEFDKLHRDRSPAVRADGSVDLRHFKNTFPQVAKDVRLVRKIPRAFGRPGRNVGGFPIEPPQPKDIDLERLAGGWVRCEKHGNIEYLVSSLAGFLNIDPKSNQFFITERLINRGGISVRTTGSLNIEAEEFDEHGDVEKGFTVSGNSIRVRGNVFGSVHSKRGAIKIGGNVSQGEIRNADGPVEIAGFASNAYIEANKGEVTLKRAENSVIRAQSVVLGEIRNCTVVADRIEIAKLQNCVIAGNSVSVGTAAIKPGVSERDENIFALEVPDLTAIERGIAERDHAIAEATQALAAKRAEHTRKQTRYGQIMALPAMRSYLDQARKAKELRDAGKPPSPEQTRAFAQQRSQLLSELTEISELATALKALEAALAPLEKSLGDLKRAKADDEAKMAELSAGVSISVGNVTGLTVVRKRKIAAQTVRIRDIQELPALRKELDSLGEASDRVFQGESGSVDWKFEPPAAGPGHS
jgi:uncharacterized protein (DUF342 family)